MVIVWSCGNDNPLRSCRIKWSSFSEFFAGMKAPNLICNEDNMPLSRSQINQLVEENNTMLSDIIENI